MVLWQAVPEELVPKVSSMLVEDIVVTKGGHQSCGIIGTKYMFEVLSAIMKRCDTTAGPRRPTLQDSDQADN